MSARDFEAYFAAFRAHDNLLEAFRSTLAPPGYPPHSPQVARILLLIHTLVHAAVIKLNEVFIKHEPTSWARYVASAEAVVDLYVSSPMDNLLHFNPIQCMLISLFLSQCPIQTKLIAQDLLTPAERTWVNKYHEEVRQKLSPLLTNDTRALAFLERECTAI